MLPSDWLITGTSCPAVGVDCLHSSTDFSNLLTWRWPSRGGAEISISFLVEQQEKIHKEEAGGNTNQKLKECSCPQSNPQTYSACARGKVSILQIGGFSIRDIYIFNKDLIGRVHFCSVSLTYMERCIRSLQNTQRNVKTCVLRGRGMSWYNIKMLALP